MELMKGTNGAMMHDLHSTFLFILTMTKTMTALQNEIVKWNFASIELIEFEEEKKRFNSISVRIESTFILNSFSYNCYWKKRMSSSSSSSSELVHHRRNK